MKVVLVVFLFSLAFGWQKFSIPNSNLYRVHHTAVTYRTWSQADANSLCPGSEDCGPYCITTSSSCARKDARNLTNVPSPSGATTGLTNTQPGCPDNCCSTENCLRTINNDGDPVPIDEDMLLIFGGKLYPSRTPGVAFTDSCETVAQALSISGSCEGTLSNDIWIYAIASDTWYSVVPSTNNGYTIPPARYGHKSVLVSLSMKDSVTSDKYTRKYMYVYGGYSSSGCSGFCNDFWRYDIPWAPQRYYPQSGTYWNRGNIWEQITTTASPGKRAFFGMASDGASKIYLFGGVVQPTSGATTFANDLWVFDISLGTWTELETSGVKTVQRDYVLWDNTVQSQSFPYNTVPQSGDILINETITTGNICNSNTAVLIPDCQAFLSLVYSENMLYLYSGYGSNGYSASLWRIDLSQSQLFWELIRPSAASSYASSISEPPALASTGALVYTAEYPFYTKHTWMVFGGVNSTASSAETYFYDLNLKLWSLLEPVPVTSDVAITTANKGMSFSVTQNELIVFGGLSTSSGSSSSVTLSGDFWIYKRDSCTVASESAGTCDWGKAVCNSGYYGTECSQQTCPGTVCYSVSGQTDPFCIYCSGHGTCSGTECACSEGFTGDDCSIKDCPNSCSNTGSELVAECIVMYPESQCRCFNDTRRGGNDCSYIFCLNDCGGHGTCIDGDCTCDVGYTAIVMNTATMLMLFFVIFCLLLTL